MGFSRNRESPTWIQRLSILSRHLGIAGFDLARTTGSAICSERLQFLLTGGRRGGPFVFEDSLARNPIFFVYPVTQVNQFAAFRAEGTAWIVLPFSGPAANGTFDGSSDAQWSAVVPGVRLSDKANASERFTRIVRSTESILPSLRVAFKRTVTLSRVELRMTLFRVAAASDHSKVLARGHSVRLQEIRLELVQAHRNGSKCKISGPPFGLSCSRR
jgi:hypothetical protein